MVGRPLDNIRRNLNSLGCPPFRLSCRWAGRKAASDKEALKDVSPDGAVPCVSQNTEGEEPRWAHRLPGHISKTVLSTVTAHSSIRAGSA